MFGLLSRNRKSLATGTRTIPIAELSPLWREPETIAGEPDSTQIGHHKPKKASSTHPSATGLETFVTRTDPPPALNNNDVWYDETAFMESLRGVLDGGKTSGFVYRQRAYYTLDTVTDVFNTQRADHKLEPLDPGAVIAFFKSDRGLASGKYVMRFESGLPIKIYLYSHPAGGKIKTRQQRPFDDTGRRMKSLKPINAGKP